ncbi:MAG: DNA polymerase III subunit delta, partial [Geodermatophilaceae bacterium]|nr:DNA polymerase III subunit delta [Geodermatophilaceae bacterium]
VRDLTASGLDPADLLDLLSPSLFAEVRVVVVTCDASEVSKDVVAGLLAYAADPVEEIWLVVVHPGGVRNKKLPDGLRAAKAVVVACPKVTRAEDRQAFVRHEVRAQGGTIAPVAVAAVLDAVGSDLRELASTCSQLVADSGGAIDVAAVARYHRGRAEVSGFSVADRMVVGDLPGSLAALRWALAVGVPHVVIADALADGVRSVARVSSAGRTPAAELARALGMPPWKVDRSRRQARSWTEAGLVRAMLVVSELNAEVKGSVADTGYALERALREVTGAHGERVAPG